MNKRIVTVETESSRVKEVKSTFDETEANALLSKGWCLLHGGVAHQDDMGFRAKPVYVLGLLNK